MYEGFQSILVEVKDRVATLTLNRPQVGNAFDVTAYHEVRDTINALGEDPEVGAIVITGAGKHFSAGGDIKGFRKAIDEGRFLPAEKVELTGQMTAAIKRCPKPVIAMVNGAAAGAGAGVAFACDFRILADNAKLILAFINLGLTGDSCSMYYLSRMIGTAKTMELMMLGKPVEADKALELGLAYKVAAADELAEVTYKFAKRLANGPTTAYAMQKAQVNKFFFADLDEFLADEGVNMEKASKTSDFSEAVNAFLEKRKPTFTGK